MQYRLYNGDCLELLKSLPDNSVDSVITDPPYGLSNHSQSDVIECLKAWVNGEVFKPRKFGFGGNAWDAWVPGPEVWKECLRVLKPGGHLLAFAGTRSMDLMCMAIRLSGFNLRDSIGYAYDSQQAPLLAWVYSSGFPKGMGVSKEMGKRLGAQREVVAINPKKVPASKGGRGYAGVGNTTAFHCNQNNEITVPSSDLAKKWNGWSTALRPAWEPIILAQKPVESTVVNNILKYGVGAINVDACRIPYNGTYLTSPSNIQRTGKKKLHFDCETTEDRYKLDKPIQTYHPLGRWPANVMLENSETVVASFPNMKGHENKVFSASRLFYCQKSSKADRNEGFVHGKKGEKNVNIHPTVKPVDLMKELIKLVTPPGGTVLDPFMGSGSTGKAACELKFKFVGIELNTEFFEIAELRIKHAVSKR